MSVKGDQHQRKVRFDQNEENNAISVDKQTNRDNSFLVHLGILKINHFYAVEFSISKSQFVSVPAIVTDISKVSNTKFCKLVSVQLSPTELSFKVELYAHTESIGLTETIVSSDLELTFVAQVLGKNEGTPFLKDGIHVLHTTHPEVDLDSTGDSSPPSSP
uniref:Adipose-secreted signaling protein n=1 Tax=Cacopsylla melanoneura TaxID=428564 RepID=A0A8D8PXR1_9HEMI